MIVIGAKAVLNILNTTVAEVGVKDLGQVIFLYKGSNLFQSNIISGFSQCKIDDR